MKRTWDATRIIPLYVTIEIYRIPTDQLPTDPSIDKSTKLSEVALVSLFLSSWRPRCTRNSHWKTVTYCPQNLIKDIRSRDRVSPTRLFICARLSQKLLLCRSWASNLSLERGETQLRLEKSHPIDLSRTGGEGRGEGFPVESPNKIDYGWA